MFSVWDPTIVENDKSCEYLLMKTFATVHFFYNTNILEMLVRELQI